MLTAFFNFLEGVDFITLAECGVTGIGIAAAYAGWAVAKSVNRYPTIWPAPTVILRIFGTTHFLNMYKFTLDSS